MVDYRDGPNIDDYGDLRHTIKGIGWHNELEFLLEMRSSGKFYEKAVVPYILNLKEADDGTFRTPLIVDNQLMEVTPGFTMHGLFYQLGSDMSLINIEQSIIQPNKNTVYIPLTRSMFYRSLFNNDQVQFDGSPFPVLGLDGSSDLSPLYLIKVDEDDISAYGFGIMKSEIQIYEDKPFFDGNSDLLLADYSEFIDSIFKDDILVSGVNLGEGLESKLNYTTYVQNENDVEVDWRKPKTIVKYLDNYVVGQDNAKKKLAVAFKKFMSRYQSKDEEIEKGNTLLIGPTGTGKTYMVSLLAKKAGLPFLESKITGKSYTGIKGENMADIFNPLAEKLLDENSSKNNAPYAVIFLDEFDKLASDKRGGGGVSMFSKLQQELIGWVEEANININYEKRDVLLNTKNILFVGAGAFSGQQGVSESIEDIVKDRLDDNKTSIGFGATNLVSNKTALDKDELRAKLEAVDLEQYGLIPELVGRFSERATLNSLTLDNLATIFSGVKGSTLDSYKKIMKLDGFKLEIDESVPIEIAKRCDEKTGARAIKGITAKLFDDIIYSPEDFVDNNKTIKITPELIEKYIPLTEKQKEKYTKINSEKETDLNL